MKKTMMLLLLMTSVMLAGAFMFTSCNKEDGTGGTTITEGQWIDLGLPSGLLWASYNVGASSPIAAGDHFAWGETQTKEEFTAATYKYCRYHSGAYYSGDNRYFFTKYCNKSFEGYEGFTDNLTVLESSDDAASAQWGGGARTPTKEEWQELLDNTTEQIIEVNGVSGHLFTGSNGRNIFLPIVSHINIIYNADASTRGTYMSSSLNTSNPKQFHALICLEKGTKIISDHDRIRGFVVRPVCSAK